jgi:glycosyltransferase involved in cell wall biosynthesis
MASCAASPSVYDQNLVDGGSRDGTPDIAAGAGACVIVEPRRGYGRACAAGVAAAREDATALAFIYGNGSDDPADAPAIIGPVIGGTRILPRFSALGRT